MDKNLRINSGACVIEEFEASKVSEFALHREEIEQINGIIVMIPIFLVHQPDPWFT